LHQVLDVRAFTRNGHDWSDKYQRIIEACTKLSCGSALIDGEVIVQNDKGMSDLQRCGQQLSGSRYSPCFLNGGYSVVTPADDLHGPEPDCVATKLYHGPREI
jgi:hypothetical protein